MPNSLWDDEGAVRGGSYGEVTGGAKLAGGVRGKLAGDAKAAGGYGKVAEDG